MITAKELRERYSQNDEAQVRRYMETTLEPFILDAANKGKTSYTLHLGSDFASRVPKPSPTHDLLIELLKSMGYRAQFGAYGPEYVAPTYRLDAGELPRRNYGIEISW